MRNKLPAPQVAADEVAVPCHKCGTTGFYCRGTRNGQPYSFTGFDCHPCGARGWIVRSKAGEERRQKRIANEAARFKAEEAARVEKQAKVDAIWIPLVPRVEALRAAAGPSGTNRRAHFEQALSKAWSQDNILSGTIPGPTFTVVQPPNVAWLVDFNDHTSIVFAPTRGAAKWAVIRSYWDAYGRRRQDPFPRVTARRSKERDSYLRKHICPRTAYLLEDFPHY